MAIDKTADNEYYIYRSYATSTINTYLGKNAIIGSDYKAYAGVSYKASSISPDTGFTANAPLYASALNYFAFETSAVAISLMDVLNYSGTTADNSWTNLETDIKSGFRNNIAVGVQSGVKNGESYLTITTNVFGMKEYMTTKIRGASNLVSRDATAGAIPYQTSTLSTAFLSAPTTNGAVLTYNTTASAPQWTSVTYDSSSGTLVIPFGV